MYYGGMGYYSSMIVLIPAMIFTMIVQGRIKRAYSRYSQVENSRRLTGAQAARMMLDANGLSGVPINILNGGDDLNNYFDPRSNSVNLSQAVYHTDSIAAMCIACHEVGHAIQHATNYAPVRIRNGIVPLVNVCNWLSMPILLIGVVFAGLGGVFPSLIDVGILLFSATVLFQLITLPVEFNASRRAMDTLTNQHLLDEEEARGAKAVLRAAALTYVAAALSAISSLLRLIILFGGRRDD